ncbi:N-acetylmuramoyl-L-alanine amidase [Halobacillus litoralis]|uniref:N-acetylmuramoyl-L-alanine amidase n=1 Tax=Halobacillus litoralis TaxID=45668 RepID=UPI001CFCF3AE|nr:N-acetylmuramoyl-L-alanine amidase [Halobacillus litoralis]
MKIVVIDAGHGGTDPGAIYQGNQEKTFNLAIALNVERILSQNYEVETIMTRTRDVTLSLDSRTSLANRLNADFFLSIHNNAAGGRGFESYVFNGPLSPNTQQYQRTIHNTTYKAMSSYGVRDRGQKRANYYVLRETNMSALLLEVLFVDNPQDLALLKNSAFINDISRAIANGVADALNLPAKEPTAPTPPSDTLFRVIAGSFSSRENAEERIEYLASNGFAGFVVPTTISGKTYYRVQTGAFSNEENAREQVDQLKSVGINDAFIVKGEDSSEPENPDSELYLVIAGSFRERGNAQKRVNALKENGIDSLITTTSISGITYYRVQAGAFSSEENALAQINRLKSVGITDAFILKAPAQPPAPIEGYTISGEMYLNACQLTEYARTVNSEAPELGAYYLKYGEIYGIRGDVAYAQAINETDFFRFTGLVSKEQNNYAGIGATGPGNPGASFSTPEEGVHAHIQHLFAYASTNPIPTGLKKVDPRFDLVTRGSAVTWNGLNGKWAVPGTTYGQNILSIYERSINAALKKMNQQMETLDRVLEDLK